MKIFVLAMAVLLAPCSSSFAFKNIEADAAYDREIKQQILTEFAIGLKLLKAQADGLGMQVREQDLHLLQQHMYDMAFLRGRCVDIAITIQKTGSAKIQLDNYVKECIETHMKFIVGLEKERGKGVSSIELCLLLADTPYDTAPPYEFLGFKQAALPKDYVAMKHCFDNRSPNNKLLDEYRR